MSRPKSWSDDELVGFVRDWRVANGACTLGDLARTTGLSKTALHQRVKTLIREGRLTQSETVGSLRTTDERMVFG